jgi:hypothetical protein
MYVSRSNSERVCIVLDEERWTVACGGNGEEFEFRKAIEFFSRGGQGVYPSRTLQSDLRLENGSMQFLHKTLKKVKV